MKQAIQLTLTFLLIMLAQLEAGDGRPSSYEQKVVQRIEEVLKPVQFKPSDLTGSKKASISDYKALLLLFKNQDVEGANGIVLALCSADRMTTYRGKPVVQRRCEGLLRIYLLERTRKLLTPEACRAIEDYAWDLLNKYNVDIIRADADKRFFRDWTKSENHFLNDCRRYYLALQVVRMSERFGPGAKLAGETIDSHCQAWDKFWTNYFRDRAPEGTDNEIANPGAYGSCTVGVYYDLYDFGGTPELRKLAGNFVTLYWAEVAGEFEPRTGQRAGWSVLRNGGYTGGSAGWYGTLLYCYLWDDKDPAENLDLGLAPFLTSGYRAPEILAAIAHDENRGSYLATSRRAMMAPDNIEELMKAQKNTNNKTYDTIVFDEKGNGHFRRDVFYTPDYAISTMTADPKRNYNYLLEQTMGATFAADAKDRISFMGRGNYASRAINGITGNSVSIIARDPKAAFGTARFSSDGTHVFVSNGSLWDKRVEDSSGWFFTRDGNAFVAIRSAGAGYQITEKKAHSKERAIDPVDKWLDFHDMWAPIVLQMGRAADYKSFEDFQAAVKASRFEYKDGKLTYVSAAKDKYEYWEKGTQPPRMNGTEVNLNPAKTYDSPYLSMVHGTKTATIKYPGFKDIELEF